MKWWCFLLRFAINEAIMKFFKKYIFPALYGLLIYFTVRLLHDTDTDTHFWRRSWALNSIELGCSILTGYLAIYFFERLFKYFDRHWPVQFDYKSIVRELAILVGINLVLVN